MNNWIVSNDTIIFHWKFNADLDIDLISNYTKLIFSDYELSNELFEHYANNDFCDLEYKGNRFNLN